MRRLHPAVPALLALATAGSAVARLSDDPLPTPPADREDSRGAAEAIPPSLPPAAIPLLHTVPFEARIANGTAGRPLPTTADEATVLAGLLADRLGRSIGVRRGPGVVVAGTGETATLARTARLLGGLRARIRSLLRMDADDRTSQLLLLEASRDRFELAGATLFDQAPLTTRTAVLGSVEDRLVVSAWWDPDAGSFLAATARAMATASIVESGLRGPGSRSVREDPEPIGPRTPSERPMPAESPTTPTTPDPPEADVSSDDGRAPAWFLEGLASQLAAATASPNALEPRQRDVGLRFLRSGGDPRRIFALAADDPGWIALDGVPQSVAFLAVQRLAEDAPANLDRLIGALRAGRSWAAAWRGSLGGTPASLAGRLVRHHAVND